MNFDVRLGISSYAFAWSVGIPGYLPDKPMNAFDLFTLVSKLGIHLIQVADNLPLHKLTNIELYNLIDMANKLNIDVEIGTRGIANNNLLKYLEIAKLFRSPILRVVIDTPGHHPSEDEIVYTIKSVIPKFEMAGIILAIENHDRFNSKTLSRIIYRIDSRYVGICLDSTNSFGTLERPQEVAKELGELVVNIHLKDFVIHRLNHNLGFIIEGTPAGEGMLNIPQFLDQIFSYGRNPSVILELWTPPEDDIKTTMEKEMQWVNLSIKNLSEVLSSHGFHIVI